MRVVGRSGQSGILDRDGLLGPVDAGIQIELSRVLRGGEVEVTTCREKFRRPFFQLHRGDRLSFEEAVHSFFLFFLSGFV